jgi:arsenate reductase
MKRKVLVLCTGNSCRSQMAEALINDRRGEQWQAFSAGTRPEKAVNPYALRVLAEIDIHPDQATPQHLDAYMGEPFDLVITVCDSAAESCPVWPGQGERIHIGFPDPAAATGSEDEILPVYRQVRDGIADQVLAALDER